jgi:hypothetical protein
VTAGGARKGDAAPRGKRADALSTGGEQGAAMTSDVGLTAKTRNAGDPEASRPGRPESAVSKAAKNSKASPATGTTAKPKQEPVTPVSGGGGKPSSPRLAKPPEADQPATRGSRGAWRALPGEASPPVLQTGKATPGDVAKSTAGQAPVTSPLAQLSEESLKTRGKGSKASKAKETQRKTLFGSVAAALSDSVKGTKASKPSKEQPARGGKAETKSAPDARARRKEAKPATPPKQPELPL